MKKCEEIKVYDINMNPIYPYKMTRKEAHHLGAWHKHFDCWIVRRDIEDDYVMFQLRSEDKSSFKGMLEVSASGHIEADETMEDGVRELKEELSIDLSFKDLKFIGIFRNAMDIEETAKKEREFCYTYIAESSAQIEDYKVQEEELGGIYEMKVSEAIKFFAGDLDKITIRGMIKDDDGNDVEDVKTIHKKDIDKTFVPYFNNYYLRVMISLERFLKGEKYIAL